MYVRTGIAYDNSRTQDKIWSKTDKRTLDQSQQFPFKMLMYIYFNVQTIITSPGTYVRTYMYVYVHFSLLPAPPVALEHDGCPFDEDEVLPADVAPPGGLDHHGAADLFVELVAVPPGQPTSQRALQGMHMCVRMYVRTYTCTV